MDERDYATFPSSLYTESLYIAARVNGLGAEDPRAQEFLKKHLGKDYSSAFRQNFDMLIGMSHDADVQALRMASRGKSRFERSLTPRNCAAASQDRRANVKNR
jgi:hypothetical protein